MSTYRKTLQIQIPC